MVQKNDFYRENRDKKIFSVLRELYPEKITFKNEG